LDLQAIPTNVELQDIPKEKKKSSPKEISEIPQMPKLELPALKPLPLTAAENIKRDVSSKKGDFMQEITPQPYQGTLVSSKITPEKPKVNTLKSIPITINTSKTGIPNSLSAETEEIHATLEKQKRLEEDMVEVLGFLSKKIAVPNKGEKKPKPKAKKEPKEKIPPSNMGDILNRLLSLDLHIEAAAIIKRDGEIIASAISSTMSDSLFATIGQNLSMIGTDIIMGLSAGDLKSISVRGTNGILDLAPIDDQESSLVKDMILIIFSHPKVKSGIIAFAVNIIKKQVIDYLGNAK
jgi:predicted regulator of Ras-like GTPase activity (Roadblock/LC7/MglB family)